MAKALPSEAKPLSSIPGYLLKGEDACLAHEYDNIPNSRIVLISHLQMYQQNASMHVLIIVPLRAHVIGTNTANHACKETILH
jgi:hypothetical protein